MFMGQRGKGALTGEARGCVNGEAGPCFQSVPFLVFTAWMAAGSSGEAYRRPQGENIQSTHLSGSTTAGALQEHYENTPEALREHTANTKQRSKPPKRKKRQSQTGEHRTFRRSGTHTEECPKGPPPPS